MLNHLIHLHHFPQLQDLVLLLFPNLIFQLLFVHSQLLLFFVLYWVARHKRYDGQVLICLLFLYPLMRTIVELFRGDEYRGFLFKFVNEPLNGLLGLPEGSATFLSTAQFISLALICAAGAGIVYLRGGAHRRTA